MPDHSLIPMLTRGLGTRLTNPVCLVPIPVYEHGVLVAGVLNEEEFGHQELRVAKGGGEEQRNTVCT